MSCSSEVSELYLGHDNTVTLVPYEDIIARDYLDMTNVTQVNASLDLLTSTVTGDDITASSSDVPTTIWWEQIGTTDEWQIHIKAGLFVSVAAGSYKMRVIIVSPTYANGLVIADDILVDIVDVP